MLSGSEIVFLNFLEKLAPEAASIAKNMESLIFDDPSSSVVKARLFAENIVSEVFNREKITTIYPSNLYEKINYLYKYGYIDDQIQRVFNTIRYSGNKAAHDSNFNDIAEALKLHKSMYFLAKWFYEVYATDFQYTVSPYETPNPKKNIEATIEATIRKQIKSLAKGGLFNVLSESEKGENPAINNNNNNNNNNNDNNDNNDNEVNNSYCLPLLPEGESYLLNELKKLQESSQEAVEGLSVLSDFKKYMHVERKIQKDLEELLVVNKAKSSSLILLCGSVGDGKSHLMAFLKEEKPELLRDFDIYNDATESFSPSKNAIETLEETLSSFSDGNIENSNKKIVIAINLGVLHNFISQSHDKYNYTELKKFVDESMIFSQKITSKYSKGPFNLINFSDYNTYELTEEGAQSSFFSSLLKKVFDQNINSPFYTALMEDKKRNVRTLAHDNYEFLQEEIVQKQLIDLVIQAIVKFKLVISARTFLNFIADITIPSNIENSGLIDEIKDFEDTVPELLFNRKERSSLLQAMCELDPNNNRNSLTDKIAIELSTLNNWEKIFEKYVKNEKGKIWLSQFKNQALIEKDELEPINFSKIFIKLTYLTNKKFAEQVKDKCFLAYLRELFYFNIGNKHEIKQIYENISNALYKWKGSPEGEKGYIYLDSYNRHYQIAQSLRLRPKVDNIRTISNNVLNVFKPVLFLEYHGENDNQSYFLEIDYQLFILLRKVNEGYRPNKNDEKAAINFVEFIERVMHLGGKSKELLICFPSDHRKYKLMRDDFGEFVFD